MADTLIGSGFDQSVGTRQLAGQTQTEFYNKQSGQGFSDPNQLSSFVNQNFQGVQSTGQNVFDVLKTQYTPIKASPSPVVDSSALAQPPKTVLDVQSLLNQNQQNQQQFISAMQPSQQEQALMQQLNQANDSLKNFDISLEGGIQNIMQKPIALEFQQGQQSALTRDAAFTRSSLARGVDSIATQLSTAQQLRDMTLQRLQAQQQFGKDDLQTALQMQQVQKQEQTAAKEFALQFGVTSQFYNIGGTIYRSGDGKVYSDPQSFFADAGVGSFNEATKKNLIQTIDGNQIKQKAQEKSLVADLAMKYADAGITLADTLATAQAKLKGSRIYAQATRLAGGGGGSGSGSGSGVRKSGSGNQPGNQPGNNTNDLQTALAFATSSMTKDQRNNAYANFSNFVKQGDTQAAQQYIEKLFLDKLPAGQKDEINTMDTLASLSKSVLGYSSDGKLEGVGSFGRGTIGSIGSKLFGTGSDEAKDVRNTIGNIKATIAKLRGGTSFTSNEEKLLDSYTPSINANQEDIISKLGSLVSFINQKRQQTIYSGLSSASPSASSSADPLGIR